MKEASSLTGESLQAIRDSFINELIKRLSGGTVSYGLSSDIASQFLGIERGTEYTLEQGFPLSRAPIMAVGAKKLIDERFEITKAVSIDDYSESLQGPSLSMIPISETKEVECYIDAIIMAKERSTGRKAVFEIDAESQNPKVAVRTVKEEAELARSFIDSLKNWVQHHNFLKGRFLEAGSNGIAKIIRIPDVSWDSLVMPQDIVDELRRNVIIPIEQESLLRRCGISPKRGVLLEGPPGVGKTLLCTLLARELVGKATFIRVTPKSIIYTQDLADIYQVARDLAPSIVWLEDIDLIARDREVNSRVELLGELMAQLDTGEKEGLVITLATTNCPEVMEKAVRERPSRFDRRIQIPMPDEQARKIMFEKFASNLNLASDVDVEYIVKATSGFTGAHMKELVASAVLLALDDESFDMGDKPVVKMSHFQSAMQQVATRRKQLGFGEL